MYTDREKKIAAQIIQDDGMKALLQKVLLAPREAFNAQMIMDKTNEALGEIVRADAIAEQKILIRWQELVRIGQSDDTARGETAPE